LSSAVGSTHSCPWRIVLPATSGSAYSDTAFTRLTQDARQAEDESLSGFGGKAQPEGALIDDDRL